MGKKSEPERSRSAFSSTLIPTPEEVCIACEKATISSTVDISVVSPAASAGYAEEKEAKKKAKAIKIAKNSVGTASAYARENKTFFIRKKIITYPYFDFKPQVQKKEIIFLALPIHRLFRRRKQSFCDRSFTRKTAPFQGLSTERTVKRFLLIWVSVYVFIVTLSKKYSAAPSPAFTSEFTPEKPQDLPAARTAFLKLSFA